MIMASPEKPTTGKEKQRFSFSCAGDPFLPACLSFVCGLAFLVFMVERAPLMKPNSWSEKRWAVHCANTVGAEDGMIICGLLSLALLFFAALCYWMSHNENRA